MIIAIDGPAASGKGTLAKRVALHFDLPHLDTGLLYRAVARDLRHGGGDLENADLAAAVARKLDPTSLDDPQLRGPVLAEAASLVARFPNVRAALIELQRAFAAQTAGAVLDGRDIGTVVCPDATVKLYVTASPEVRARRRHLEMVGRGERIEYAAVLADIKRRDERDAGREAAPMRPASDAILLDTSNLDIETAFEMAVGVIARKVGQRRRT
ncbi:MAG TPA: (d)CMP kinase [Hyphomicrobiaceae bacterium]|nr:(d)CMP kinase [Hyphomicrobiaceae bacterium]